MNILHVIPSVSPARGGPSRVVKMLSQAQCNAGHRVTVATTDDDGDARRMPAPAEALGGGVVHRVFPRQSGFYTVSLPLAQWLNANVARFDAIHVHALFSFSATAAAWAAWRRGMPYVIRPLGTLNRWGIENRRPLFKKASLAAVESRILRQSAAVHFTSEQERDQAAALGIAYRPVVVPNPVLAVPRTGSAACPRDPSTVLFLGRIDPIKRLDLLLGAMKHVPSGARLIVAGGGGGGDVQLLARLRRQAAQLTVPVEWTGPVDDARKAELLARATVFVLPSHSENFGVAAAEAMAAGVPVVVSTGVALHADVERAGAGLVVPGEEEPLGAAIGRLLADRGMALRCGAAGRRLAEERYSTAVVAAQLVSLYEEIAR